MVCRKWIWYTINQIAIIYQYTIKEVSFDEMWHFVEQKKTSYGSRGQWSAVEIGQSAGVSY